MWGLQARTSFQPVLVAVQQHVRRHQPALCLPPEGGPLPQPQRQAVAVGTAVRQTPVQQPGEVELG